MVANWAGREIDVKNVAMQVLLGSNPAATMKSGAVGRQRGEAEVVDRPTLPIVSGAPVTVRPAINLSSFGRLAQRTELAS